MKILKILKILGVILLVIVLLVVGVLLFLSYQLGKGAEDRVANQAAMVKSDEELLGEHFYVPRQGLDPVDVNIYLPEDGVIPKSRLYRIFFKCPSKLRLDTQKFGISFF